MDDSNNFAEDVKSAQERIRKIVDMLESKLLNINLEKTNFIVFGAKNSRKKVQKELETNPINCRERESRSGDIREFENSKFV